MPYLFLNNDDDDDDVNNGYNNNNNTGYNLSIIRVNFHHLSIEE